MKKKLFNIYSSPGWISVLLCFDFIICIIVLITALLSKQYLWMTTAVLLLIILIMLELLYIRPIQQILKISIEEQGENQSSLEVKFPALTRLVRRLAEQAEADVNRKSLEQLNEIANIKLLQSQISPHFLYNTLECVRGELYVREMYDLADTLESLSSIFRFNIDQKKMLIPFSEELSNAEKYVQIMQFRFTNRFQFLKSFDETDEVIMNYTMPKLTLQPIIENAIHHGLETRIGTGLISLNVKYTDLSMVITISDNGTGMDSKTLESINLSLTNQEKPGMTESEKRGRNGIALYNINERIHLLYGKQYGLSVSSSPNFGTQVNLMLPRNPIITFEENYDGKE